MTSFYCCTFTGLFYVEFRHEMCMIF